MPHWTASKICPIASSKMAPSSTAVGSPLASEAKSIQPLSFRIDVLFFSASSMMLVMSSPRALSHALASVASSPNVVHRNLSFQAGVSHSHPCILGPIFQQRAEGFLSLQVHTASMLSPKSLIAHESTQSILGLQYSLQYKSHITKHPGD